MLLGIEVVEQIGKDNDVVRVFEFDGECIAGDCGVAIADAQLCCVTLGDFEGSGPIECGDSEIGIFLGESDAKESMAPGEVK